MTTHDPRREAAARLCDQLRERADDHAQHRANWEAAATWLRRGTDASIDPGIITAHVDDLRQVASPVDCHPIVFALWFTATADELARAHVDADSIGVGRNADEGSALLLAPGATIRARTSVLSVDLYNYVHGCDPARAVQRAYLPCVAMSPTTAATYAQLREHGMGIADAQCAAEHANAPVPARTRTMRATSR